MKCILVLLAVAAWTEAGVLRKASGDRNDGAGGHLTVTEHTERTNNKHKRDSIKRNGGTAVSHLRFLRKTKPCVLYDCMWPKASDGKVYIPYVIANHYSSQELDIIERGINSFSSSTCIRFFPRTNQRDFLYIQSLDGCSSYVGRRGNGQTVSLSRQGCIHYGTVQHELLHALGFNHEHCRSDRENHIRVLLQNIIKGQEFNFNKVNTLNQRTPYDYGSVMHYSSLAFSKDKHKPTMVGVPDRNTVFGTAKQMSQSDVNRVNLLYCRN